MPLVDGQRSSSCAALTVLGGDARMVVLAVPLELTVACDGVPDHRSMPLTRMKVTVPASGLAGPARQAGAEGHRLGGVRVVGRRACWRRRAIVGAPGGLAAERGGAKLTVGSAGVGVMVGDLGGDLRRVGRAPVSCCSG